MSCLSQKEPEVVPSRRNTTKSGGSMPWWPLVFKGWLLCCRHSESLARVSQVGGAVLRRWTLLTAPPSRGEN